MGNQEIWEGKDLSLLNGLLPNEVSRVTRTLDADRWSLAESRIDELIKCIQPNRQSDVCRDAVVDYVRGLISNRLSCEVGQLLFPILLFVSLLTVFNLKLSFNRFCLWIIS